LSMIVVGSMVGLMSNSLGSTTRIIQMTQLGDELRNTMSMVSRDLRRANYNANAAKCFANSDCGLDGSASQIGPLDIENGNCLIFGLDRDQDGSGTGVADGAGGFRLASTGGVGFIEMWVGTGDESPACDDVANVADDDWVALTDPNIVDIRDLAFDDSNSLLQSVVEEGGVTLNQSTRQVKISIEGALLVDSDVTRRIEDTVRVRNDYLWHP